MTDEDKTELERLRLENKRLGFEAKYYKEEREALCEAAEEYISSSICYLRGRPGHSHPTMVAMRKLDSRIDHARHTHIFIESMLRTK